MTLQSGHPAQARVATMAAFFINGAAMATWAANIPSVREHLHLSEPALGLVLVALAVGCVLALVLVRASGAGC